MDLNGQRSGFCTDKEWQDALDYWAYFRASQNDKIGQYLKSLNETDPGKKSVVENLLNRAFRGFATGFYAQAERTKDADPHSVFPTRAEREHQLLKQHVVATYKALTLRVGQDDAYMLMSKTIKAAMQAVSPFPRTDVSRHIYIDMPEVQARASLPALAPEEIAQAARNDENHLKRVRRRAAKATDMDPKADMADGWEKLADESQEYTYVSARLTPQKWKEAKALWDSYKLTNEKAAPLFCLMDERLEACWTEPSGAS